MNPPGDRNPATASGASAPTGGPSRPPLEIDAALVAEGLGLEVSEFRRLMDAGRITVLCERGTGEDTGTWRASFYHGARRARFLLDRSGRVIDPPRTR